MKDISLALDVRVRRNSVSVILLMLSQSKYSFFRSSIVIGALLCFWGVANYFFPPLPNVNSDEIKIAESRDDPLGKLKVFYQGQPEKGVLFLISDAAGLNQSLETQARQWAQKSYVVVAVDWPGFLERQHGSGCIDLANALLKKHQAIASQFKLDQDAAPMIMGEGEGATAAYIALAQGFEGAFHAGISLNFCPAMTTKKGFCEGRQLHFQSNHSVVPDKALNANWYVFQGEAKCEENLAKSFVSEIDSAKFSVLTTHNHQIDLTEVDALLNWLDPRLTDQAKSASAHGELPLVEVPAVSTDSSDLMVILLTGDGGWAELDKSVASAFAARGIPTVALDSLSYYWKLRTPEEAAEALSHLINRYGIEWNKDHIVIVGYSFGADVLPFLLSRLPEDDRKRLVGAVYLGLSEQANFEFHLTNWLDAEPKPSAYKTLLELPKINWLPAICIEGKDDEASICDQTGTLGVKVLSLPGDHHYNEDYATLAQSILDFIHPK